MASPVRIGGFTLIELLVVVSILAVLMAILLPAAGLVRGAARQSQCLDVLRQIQLANAAYANDQGGTYVQINNGGVVPAWYTNPAFLDLLEMKSLVWPRSLLCPDSYSVISGADTVSSCYGANVGITVPSPIPNYAFATAAVPRPSDKLAWADAWDWWINAYNSHKFDVERKPSNTAPSWTDSMATAYRHQGKACLAFYDGHVEARARAQVDTGMLAGAAKTALENQLWNITAP